MRRRRREELDTVDKFTTSRFEYDLYCNREEMEGYVVFERNKTYLNPNTKLARSNTDELTWSIWDLGGQDTFHALHNLFMTRQGVYLLVFDMHRLYQEMQERMLSSTMKESIHATSCFPCSFGFRLCRCTWCSSAKRENSLSCFHECELYHFYHLYHSFILEENHSNTQRSNAHTTVT